MAPPTLEEIADDVGAVVAPAKSYQRLVRANKTLAYVEPRKLGFRLNFRGIDLEDAPKTALRDAEAKGDRVVLLVEGDATAARKLLRHVAQRLGAEVA